MLSSSESFSTKLQKSHPNYSLYCVLAILNSKLATFFHFNHSPKATKGAFPKILVQDIKDFPLPVMSDDSITILDRLVKQIIQAKDHSLSANTTDFENQIDKLVYRIYGLTYDEVLIVDPDTPITEEEYNNEGERNE